MRADREDGVTVRTNNKIDMGVNCNKRVRVVEKRVCQKVEKVDEGIKLEYFLRKRMLLTKNEVSRAKFQELGICVNGVRRKVNAFLKAGDLVEVLLETGDKTSGGVVSVRGKISVLYEDSDVIVVDKPSGLMVHPTGNRKTDTLANRLAAYFREKDEDSVIRIFGRLDRDTSGVVLAVKNRAAATRLERQRQSGDLFKEYLAVVESRPEPAQGKIVVPLGVDPENRNRMKIGLKGKQAVTCYETLETREKYSLIRLCLETGRTHQIRVHMAYIGCPLVGDSLYGKGAASGMRRTALHAQRIHFLQPFTGEEIWVEAIVPEDMRQLWCYSLKL